MTDRRLEAPGDHAHAVPRDLPDQQAHDGPDPLDVDGPDVGGAAGRYGAPDGSDDDVDHPIPDEPSG
ncbi:hypothetical protein SBI_07405 [Streptomyces bingchenggensis BCW-1]|uniref:Uncharacterized protein n=1 Tax=Streptomyces bingchenggensis (strain BCW-1) TaxID=749414 RepID=D7C7H1_STRBB|nr:MULTISPECIES: hypothetical protein [Streptomyces]ADI10525.1 hypothetical protein SBI_07405 [Streptomyces bingchenggensis BCW-1]